MLFTALDVTHSDYYYPLEAEQQLLQYVRAGDAAKAQEVLGLPLYLQTLKQNV